MASVQFNVSKGREVEFYNRVDTNDPANSALIMLVLASGGEGVQNLRDYDDVAALVVSNPEVTNSGYARKTLTDANLSAYTVDDTNNWILLTLPLQTFTAIATGDVWDIVVVAYDSDTTSGTDANLIPITAGEIRENGTAIAPAGGNVVIDYSGGWITAT